MERSPSPTNGQTRSRRLPQSHTLVTVRDLQTAFDFLSLLFVLESLFLTCKAPWDSVWKGAI